MLDSNIHYVNSIPHTVYTVHAYQINGHTVWRHPHTISMYQCINTADLYGIHPMNMMCKEDYIRQYNYILKVTSYDGYGYDCGLSQVSIGASSGGCDSVPDVPLVSESDWKTDNTPDLLLISLSS